MRKLLTAILVLFLTSPLLCSPLHAEVKEYKLDNGLKVLITEDHKAPYAVFQIWYRVGSRDEPAGKTGISHLLEHMMFKGTEKYGPKEFSKMVQRYGGTENAFTTKDYTVYFQRLPSNRIGLSIDIESDRMQNLLLDPKETVSERDVVMEERRLRYDDDPQNLLYEELMAAAFKAYPYQWPVIGWMSDIKSIEPDDLKAYYKKYYSPDNAVIIVAGDVSADEFVKKIEKGFGGIKPGPKKEPFLRAEPPQSGQRRVTLKKEAELPYVMAAYLAPAFPDKDAFGLEVLAQVLSGGKSSRIYKSLIYEKKLALSASAGFDGLGSGPAVFYLEGTASPGRDIADLENAIYAEIERVKSEPPTERELQKVKNQIEASFIMGQDSIFFQAQLLGMYEMAGGWGLRDKYLEGVRAVTQKDLADVIDKYLTEDRRTVGTLIPLIKTTGPAKEPAKGPMGGHK